ncbi:MAG: hypothetical protein M3304_05495 [Actinomycetota bacterium]|nr:hypothetical protein [Actinomycetota bacterium]
MSLRRTLLTLVCGFSSGVHAALVPEHLEETPAIGVAFIPAAIFAGLCALALARWPGSPWPPRFAALLLLGMIAAYVVAVTVAVPGVEGTPEPVETIAVATKVVELLGFAIAVTLIGQREEKSRGPSLSLREEGEESDFGRRSQAVQEERVLAPGEAAETSMSYFSTTTPIPEAVARPAEDGAAPPRAARPRSESDHVGAALGVGLVAVSLYYLVERLRH